jgi:hypothetical protein
MGKDQKEVDADNVKVQIGQSGKANLGWARLRSLAQTVVPSLRRLQLLKCCHKRARDSPKEPHVEMTEFCFGFSDGRPEDRLHGREEEMRKLRKALFR